jgi:hypothetical protein
MQTPLQSLASGNTGSVSVKMSNGAGDEIGWLAEQGHLCGFNGRARFESIEQAAQAAVTAEKRHNLYADVCFRDD